MFEIGGCAEVWSSIFGLCLCSLITEFFDFFREIFFYSVTFKKRCGLRNFMALPVGPLFG